MILPKFRETLFVFCNEIFDIFCINAKKGKKREQNCEKQTR